MGSLFDKGGRVRIKENLKNKYTAKWVCPKYIYDGNLYPNMLSGSAYVMTRSVAKCLFKATLMLPFVHLEDVMVTGTNLLYAKGQKDFFFHNLSKIEILVGLFCIIFDITTNMTIKRKQIGIVLFLLTE